MNKDNDIKNLDDFLNSENQETKNDVNQVVIQPKTGLVERVDKKLIVEDGRELLRERLY